MSLNLPKKKLKKKNKCTEVKDEDESNKTHTTEAIFMNHVHYYGNIKFKSKKISFRLMKVFLITSSKHHLYYHHTIFIIINIINPHNLSNIKMLLKIVIK